MKPLPPFVVPSPLGVLLSRLPAYPGSVLLAAAVNTVVASHLPQDVLQMLLHRKLRIHVRDARLTFDLSWTGRRFSAVRPNQATDLTISANAHDFMLLAQRQEDPDTLFFNRRLSMEGDTELGLVVKNTLDGLELPVFDWQHWTPQQVLARMAPRRAAGPTPGAKGRL